MIWPSRPMIAGFRVERPPQWGCFISRNPDQRGEKPELAPATPETLIKAHKINRKVNALTYRREDRDKWQIADLDTLEPPEDGFDCEDAALTKRALLTRHLPIGALRPCLCRTTEHHMVLLLCTDRGEMVLDIGSHFVVPWNRFRAIWIARWAGERWERIVG